MAGKHSGKKYRVLDEKVLQQMDKVKEKLYAAATEYEQLAESYLLGEASQQARNDALRNKQQTYNKLARLHCQYLQKNAYNSSQL